MQYSSKNHKQFVFIFLLIFCPLLLLLIGINFIIDPLNIHQTPLLANVNTVKVNLDKHQRLCKAIEIARKKPQAIQLGSSRVKCGINPEDIKDITGIETYNAAFNGANVEEIFHYFEHALYHQPDLKVVVIGLDFCAFNDKIKPQPDFCLDRLKNSSLIWRDFNASLLSKHALKNSYETFMANFYSNHLSPSENEILKKGELSFLKMTLQCDYKKYRNDEKKIEMVKSIVETCQKRSIDLKIFLCPMQAMYWEAIYRSHLWSSFEELKRQLSHLYSIWDFSGFNCVTTCSLEGESQQSLYFECSHFSSIVGKMILEKMFHQSETPSNFGVLLTPQTVEHDLVNMRQQAHNWLESHENIMEQIEKAKDW